VHPPLVDALLGDARTSAGFRGERHEFRSRADAVGQMLRLALVSDAYLAQVCYRVGVALRNRGVPLLPRLARLGAAAVAQVHIGPDVVIQPGLYLAHGQVTISGRVHLGPRVVCFPWSTIDGSGGPVTVGTDARIGTGAVVEGPCALGDHARVGANAAVTGDVAARTVVAGVPARPV
jgi:serine O-acetyltransferase